MNLTFWTNTIHLRPIRHAEVCKQVGTFEKGRERTWFEASRDSTLWANFYLSLLKPAFQLYVASGFADTHTKLWPYKEGQPEACVLHLHSTRGSNNGCKKKNADSVYCVILTHRTQTTGFADVCGEVCQGIVEEILYWALFKPLNILPSTSLLAWISQEARGLKIPSSRNNLHANSASAISFFISHYCSYLLLVFPLRMQPGLYAFPGLLESLSLGHLCWVVGTHAYNVCTGEDENVGDQLQENIKKKRKTLGYTLETCHQ